MRVQLMSYVSQTYPDPCVMTTAMNRSTAQMAFENGIQTLIPHSFRRISRNHRIKLNFCLSQIKLFFIIMLFVLINQMHILYKKNICHMRSIQKFVQILSKSNFLMR